MKKNVGTLDALMRISWGLFGLGWGISRMVKYPHRGMPIFISFMSAMKVAEGVTRWCPLLDVLGINTVDKIEYKEKPNNETMQTNE